MRQYTIPTPIILLLLLFLLIALSQSAQLRQLDNDTQELQAAVDEVVEERIDILTRPRVAAVAIADGPGLEITVEEPVFVPLDIIPLDDDLQEYIWLRCQQEGIPFEIMMALMEHESGFNPDAVGYNKNGTQDSGLTQINDVNRGWLADNHGITDLMDPYQSADAGIIILSMFWDYGPELALTAYGRGEAGMLQTGTPSRAALDILGRSEFYAQEMS